MNIKGIEKKTLIDLENILLYHSKIIKDTGVSNGVRDMGLAESALGRAETSFDGNKRIDLAVMLLLFRPNYINIKYTQKELIELGLNIVQWIINHKI